AAAVTSVLVAPSDRIVVSVVSADGRADSDVFDISTPVMGPAVAVPVPVPVPVPVSIAVALALVLAVVGSLGRGWSELLLPSTPLLSSSGVVSSSPVPA